MKPQVQLLLTAPLLPENALLSITYKITRSHKSKKDEEICLQKAQRRCHPPEWLLLCQFLHKEKKCRRQLKRCSMLFETVTNLPSSLPPTRQRLPWTCPCLPLGRSLQTRYSLKNSHPTENSTFSGKPASPGRLAPTSAPSHTMSSMFPEFKIPCLAFMAAIIIVKSWVLTASTWWHNQVCYNISRPTRANHLLSIQTVGRQVSGLHHSYLLRLLLQYTIQVYILALIPILFQRNPPAFLVLQSVVAGRTLLRKPLQHGSSERWRSDEVFSIQYFHLKLHFSSCLFFTDHWRGRGRKQMRKGMSRQVFNLHIGAGGEDKQSS